MLPVLPDFPAGPLDFYRKRASFDWKKLKTFIETEEVVKFQNDLLKVLQANPVFHDDHTHQTLDEQRHKTLQRAFSIADVDLSSISTSKLNLSQRQLETLRTMAQLSPESCAKRIAGELFTNALAIQGTEKHRKFIHDIETRKIHGCLCMTEIGHGSYTNGMRTTATYDKDKREFVLDTPDFQAAKCWAGCLGKVSTHAVVYAQLYIDGMHYGLQGFVVPIRDPKTLLPFVGVTVADMGEKIGLNGIDNGVLIFDKYRIPADCYLNKYGDITPEGDYINYIKDAQEKQTIIMGSIFVARIGVIGAMECYGTKALTIAIRYAAVRRQFGPSDGEEVPILEYQSHQHRLLPYLSVMYVARFFSSYLSEIIEGLFLDSSPKQNAESLSAAAAELHALCSASKSVLGWMVRDAIQECREACGGHGYLKVAGIGHIRDDFDAVSTYDGENHVLIQQTSNWLVKLWSRVEAGGQISTPLQTANFLSDASRILKLKLNATSVEKISQPEDILQAYQWLVCYLAKQTKAKLATLTQTQGPFWARSNTQVFYAKSLSTAFLHYVALRHLLTKIDAAANTEVKNVLLKLFSLYGVWTLEKFLPTLYQGGYVQGPEATSLVHEAILALCHDVKDDAVSLVDAMAPPDFILNSVLGASDGQVYQRLKSAIFMAPGALGRPSWWREVVTLKNKL
ncbi:peroxisomal acyl-coenzyme A oxidase 3-like [Zophobas morio]|uniref:peroxisomal acyl-coenzyme A oxidase 3-like n=1 Tax=Zophobas morio TaxID=2755281 RepID=UPI003082F8B7